VVLGWFEDLATNSPAEKITDTDDASAALSSVYNRISKVTDDETRACPAPTPKSAHSTLKDKVQTLPEDLRALLYSEFEHDLLALLVAVHGCVPRDDWVMMAPRLWQMYGGRSKNVKAVSVARPVPSETDR
jgi:hypothetical protein